MNWWDALETKLDLLDWHSTTLASRYYAGFAADRAARYPHSAQAEGSAHRLNTVCLRYADPVYVADDMATVVEAAAAGFQAETLIATDFFTPWAFVLFPGPVMFHDSRGRQMSYRAASWLPMLPYNEDLGSAGYAIPDLAPQLMQADPDVMEAWAARGGVTLTLWSHEDDPCDVDIGGESFAAMNARMGAAGAGTFPKLTMLHIEPLAFHQPITFGATATDYAVRYLQAFLRIAAQTITTRQQVAPPRPTRRRAQRALAHDDNYVTVINLRRKGGGGHPADRAGYDHRFLVSGHWRNQWYPGIKAHRQIWIAPYIKGPAGAELIVRAHRAYQLVQ